MQEQPHHTAQQHNVNHHPAQAAVQHLADGGFITRSTAVEHAVKPAKEALLTVLLPLCSGLRRVAQRAGVRISATSTESTIAETMVIEN